MNKKALLVPLIIIFLLLLLYIPLSQPIEGGLIFIVIGVIWLGVQTLCIERAYCFVAL